MALRAWMRIGQPLEPVLDDYERCLDAWEAGGVRGLVALDLASGETAWQFDTGAAISASPAIAAGRLLIGASDGTFYCFGQEDNNE